MDDYKHMIDNKSRDIELSSMKFDASKMPSGNAAEEPHFDPRVMEAFLKFLETELIDPAADTSASEPDYLLDEPTNGWPGYPYL